MRWAALPAGPNAAAGHHLQRAESRYFAERPLLRTSLAVDEEASQTAPSSGAGFGCSVLSDEAKVAVAAERLEVHQAAPDGGHVAIPDNWDPRTGPDSRGTRRLSRHRRDTFPPGRNARLPKKPPPADEIEHTRRWLMHALLPHCTSTDYIASALHAAERLGPVADELKCLRGSLEKKYARLTMPYVDHTSYLQNSSTGIKVAMPRLQRGQSMWRSASTLAVAKHTSVAELAIGAVSKVRSQHDDTLGGMPGEASRAQLQHEIKMPS